MIDDNSKVRGPSAPSVDFTLSMTVYVVFYFEDKFLMHIVQVIIDIPKVNGGDCIIILPVTIGTIPQGHKTLTEAEVQGASNIHGK